ncbi:MAG TPA: hypothetical protein VGJ66_11035 [Pyrinomonadaceae bacterium]|jgi:cell shape-determining protein MreC
MRIIVFATWALSFLTLTTGNSFAQAQQSSASQASATQNGVVGVVTAVDKATSQLTIKTDTGVSIAIATDDKSAVLRLPPGETSAQKAVKITLGDITAGDRMFARGTTSADGKSVNARQVVVTSGAASPGVAQDPQRQRQDFRQRGLVGRITALDPTKKEISLQSRSRENTGPIAVVASDATRFFRYAPDSFNLKDANRSSFADLKVGDQLRAVGNRSEDGTRFTADEIIAGSMTRNAGQVVAVSPGTNELTIKNAQGKTITVAIGPRSLLRRVTPEAAAALEASRPPRQASGAGRSGPGGEGRPEGRQSERRDRSAGQDGEQRRPRAGRGFQEMLESLPAISVNDLKKGDTVFVSGSEGTNPSHMTAVMLVTGDPAFMNRFLQTGPNGGPQSPGLPGDVMGGGVGTPERPTNP